MTDQAAQKFAISIFARRSRKTNHRPSCKTEANARGAARPRNAKTKRRRQQQQQQRHRNTTSDLSSSSSRARGSLKFQSAWHIDRRCFLLPRTELAQLCVRCYDDLFPPSEREYPGRVCSLDEENVALSSLRAPIQPKRLYVIFVRLPHVCTYRGRFLLRFFEARDFRVTCRRLIDIVAPRTRWRRWCEYSICRDTIIEQGTAGRERVFPLFPRLRGGNWIFDQLNFGRMIYKCAVRRFSNLPSRDCN